MSGARLNSVGQLGTTSRRRHSTVFKSVLVAVLAHVQEICQNFLLVDMHLDEMSTNDLNMYNS